MDPDDIPRMGTAELRTLASVAAAAAPCAVCAPLQAPGWESMPSSFERRQLVRVGTLRDPAVDEPTLQEHHPGGTHGWSPDAPIAVDFHPYNRCDVFVCSACRRSYLRYTEYGGYYEDERVRRVDPALLVDTGAAR